MIQEKGTDHIPQIHTHFSAEFGGQVTYSYNTENNLLGITDANGHTTNFTHDAFGRVTQTTFPSSFYESYAYDAIGKLTSKTDRKGQTIQYVYDALNRLTLIGQTAKLSVCPTIPQSRESSLRTTCEQLRPNSVLNSDVR